MKYTHQEQMKRNENLNVILNEVFPDLDYWEVENVISTEGIANGYETTEETVNNIIKHLDLEKELDFTKDLRELFVKDEIKLSQELTDTIKDYMDQAYLTSEDCSYIGDNSDLIQWYREMFVDNDEATRELFELMEPAIDTKKLAECIYNDFSYCYYNQEIAKLDGFYYIYL